MPHIRIPHEHFIKSAKTQYSDHKRALFREAIQNSVDAGAKNIQIITMLDRIVVIDDGVGMTADVVENALLTLSGSFKTAGSIGGFGAAKEILLFQHDSYEVRTNSTLVKGRGPEYTIEEVPFVQGTSLTMVMDPSYGYVPEDMDAICRHLLASCDIAANVTINGDTVKSLEIGSLVKEYPWGKVYSENARSAVEYATVRIKGVTMFQSWIGSDIKKRIIIEITKPSTEIMTSNRDGFTWEINNEMSKLVQEITIDKQSFGRCYNTIYKFDGQRRSWLVRLKEQVKTLSSFRGNQEAIKAFVDAVEQEAESIQTPQAAMEMAKTLKIETVVGRVVKAVMAVDFYVQINDQGHDKIPAELAPGTMIPKYMNMAKLWKACLLHVAECNFLDTQFCVGFVVDERCEALYASREIHLFMLSPYIMGQIPAKERVFKMLITAAHEMVHMRGYKYHDENFNNLVEQFIAKCLPTFSANKLMARAKAETI